VSQLADRFIKDPNEAVKVGEKIKVRVLEVDMERKRISLTAKKGGAPPQPGAKPQQAPSGGRPQQGRVGGQQGQQGQQGQKGQAPQQGKGNEPGFRNNPFAAHFRK